VGDMGSIPGLGRSLEKEMAIHSSPYFTTIIWYIKKNYMHIYGDYNTNNGLSRWC